MIRSALLIALVIASVGAPATARAASERKTAVRNSFPCVMCSTSSVGVGMAGVSRSPVEPHSRKTRRAQEPLACHVALSARRVG